MSESFAWPSSSILSASRNSPRNCSLRRPRISLRRQHADRVMWQPVAAIGGFAAPDRQDDRTGNAKGFLDVPERRAMSVGKPAPLLGQSIKRRRRRYSAGVWMNSAWPFGGAIGAAGHEQIRQGQIRFESKRGTFKGLRATRPASAHPARATQERPRRLGRQRAPAPASAEGRPRTPMPRAKPSSLLRSRRRPKNARHRSSDEILHRRPGSDFRHRRCQWRKE